VKQREQAWCAHQGGHPPAGADSARPDSDSARAIVAAALRGEASMDGQHRDR
jgi:hypothetical protein